MARPKTQPRVTGMKDIRLRIIPHDQQRYQTCGDYFSVDQGIEVITASKLPKEVYSHLVLVHELVERIICYHTGVSNESIDAFDMEYEKNRKYGDDTEPGDMIAAPYYRAHQIATVVEKLLAVELGVIWADYEKSINDL